MFFSQNSCWGLKPNSNKVQTLLLQYFYLVCISAAGAWSSWRGWRGEAQSGPRRCSAHSSPLGYWAACPACDWSHSSHSALCLAAAVAHLNPLMVPKWPECQMWKVALNTLVFFSLFSWSWLCLSWQSRDLWLVRMSCNAGFWLADADMWPEYWLLIGWLPVLILGQQQLLLVAAVLAPVLLLLALKLCSENRKLRISGFSDVDFEPKC